MVVSSPFRDVSLPFDVFVVLLPSSPTATPVEEERAAPSDVPPTPPPSAAAAAASSCSCACDAAVVFFGVGVGVGVKASAALRVIESNIITCSAPRTVDDLLLLSAALPPAPVTLSPSLALPPPPLAARLFVAKDHADALLSTNMIGLPLMCVIKRHRNCARQHFFIKKKKK